VDQPLGSVPDQITHSLLGVDPQQMLEDAQEGDLLGRVEDVLEDGVEHVEVRVEVDPVRSLKVGLVRLLLLVKHIELYLEVTISTSETLKNI
jgi:hypothetical protein